MSAGSAGLVVSRCEEPRRGSCRGGPPAATSAGQIAIDLAGGAVAAVNRPGDEGAPHRRRVSAREEQPAFGAAQRFVLLDDRTLGLFTIYDGDFETYISDFLKYVGPLFDILVSHAEDPTPQPVQKNPQEFIAWSKAHDLPSVRGVFSAYPDLSVQDIKALAAR
jgi:hypothetical protein